MVQGCDVWLTLPSADGGGSLGTVTAAVNGAPQLGPSASAGVRWTFDDSRALYRALEEEIVPAFYDRNRAGVPEAWTRIVRAVLSESIPRYTARRAVIDATSHSSFTRV